MSRLRMIRVIAVCVIMTATIAANLGIIAGVVWLYNDFTKGGCLCVNKP